MERFEHAVGILAGTFNPPTRAHLALARSALAVVERVLFALPRAFPHKDFTGASFEDRLEMLRLAVAGEPRFSILTPETGLFIDIARAAAAPGARLLFVCGRDAAERVLGWDYGRPGAIREQLEEFELLVADRAGVYRPPPDLAGRIHRLALGEDLGAISATDVRRRIAGGQPWEHLVPEAIVGRARSIYRR